MPHKDTIPEAERLRRAVGRILRIERLRLGLTPQEVVRQLGVTVPALCQWEHGHQLPRTHHMIALCRLLGLPLWMVFKRAEEALAAGPEEA